jgi:ATP-dependent exoDNAse (exonuclease V) beta subunit
VALTRAKDLLVLSGEGNASSWRGLVEGALAGRRDLLRTVTYEQVRGAGEGFGVGIGAGGAERAVADGAEEDAAAEGAAAEGAAAGVALAAPRLAEAAPLPAVRVAVTELAEYARCPRRHLLGRILGVTEPRPASAAPADDPARATARGTLAHAMLAEVDLAAPPLERRAQLAAVASRRGYDPQSPGVRRILSEVLGFLESPAGRRLAGAAREGRLEREVPFLLRLGGAPTAVYLVGALDALVRGPRDELAVVDFKYATPRPDSADRYRLQLAAYALAAGRAHPGAKVRATLQFLRGDLRAIDLTPAAAALAAFEEEAPRLAAALARAHPWTPAELSRDEARCRAEGCGYVGRCYG